MDRRFIILICGRLPRPPQGYQYLVGADNTYLRGADGAYLLGATQ